MQIFRSTFSTIRVFVTLALLFSVSASLVEYMCGDVVETAPTRITDVHQARGAHLGLCSHDSLEDEQTALCGKVQRSVPNCVIGECTVELDKQVLALNTEKPSLRLALPARLVERISTEVVFSSPSVLWWSTENGGARPLVSVRLLTSTFLL